MHLPDRHCEPARPAHCEPVPILGDGHIERLETRADRLPLPDRARLHHVEDRADSLEARRRVGEIPEVLAGGVGGEHFVENPDEHAGCETVRRLGRIGMRVEHGAIAAYQAHARLMTIETERAGPLMVMPWDPDRRGEGGVQFGEFVDVSGRCGEDV